MSRIDAIEGVVFDLQRLSLQDGPGIRTSVFLKGCPLRCAWCHNPESLRIQPQLCYTARLCTGCGACPAVCPAGAHRFEGGEHRVDFGRCTACGACLKVCCYDALRIVGRRMTVEQLLEALKPDLPYFAQPDARGETGGVTLTGGEPMAQFGFVQAFLREKGRLNVWMETCGHAPTRQLLQIAPHVDGFLFDYKATDPMAHRRLCGVDNARILTNLDALYRGGARIVLRLPLVPGVNDDNEHLGGIAALLAKYPRIERAEIMPYHRLGVSKAEQTGQKPPEVDQANATPEDAERWLHRLRELGAARVVLS